MMRRGLTAHSWLQRSADREAVEAKLPQLFLQRAPVVR